MRRSFTTFKPCYATFDGFNRPSNALLHEVRSKVGFIAELVVQGTFCFDLRSNVVSVVASMPIPFTRGVRTMFELLNGFPKRGFAVFGDVELNDGGVTVFYDVSHDDPVSLKCPGVGRHGAWFVVVSMRFLLSLLRSLRSLR